QYDVHGCVMFFVWQHKYPQPIFSFKKSLDHFNINLSPKKPSIEQENLNIIRRFLLFNAAFILKKIIN
ncbi:hypothetical protein, partial [Sinomicrobium oceani]|uniref:hypothetical protein n=1 Tax=Sinomicrobium oceani TaxID=1150368 RepID=UPI001C3149A1